MSIMRDAIQKRYMLSTLDANLLEPMKSSTEAIPIIMMGRSTDDRLSYIIRPFRAFTKYVSGRNAETVCR